MKCDRVHRLAGWQIVVGLISMGIGLNALSSCQRRSESQASLFAGDQACGECHTKELAAWRGSHHDLAMQVATEQTVLGDFNNVTFTHQTVTSRFFKRGDQFIVNTEGPHGEYDDFEIKYTFGVTPLQQYLIEFPGGRLQCLTIAWDTVKRQWFHLYPDQRIARNDPLHWTRIYQNWNSQCADCHSTNLTKGYEPASDTYHTTWNLINVSCEACHGPGREHVEWARGPKSADAYGTRGNGLTIDLKSDARRQVESCAPCHSRRSRISAESWYGKPLLDTFAPALLREGLYHTDGQILEEVYVYGSFLQSKMYHSGVACSDCHDPHSLKLVVEGNALCAQCHQTAPHTRFTTLQLKDYDSPQHHHHLPSSAGAQCVNCHAPARTYMVVDPRRDHSFRVPRPDLSVKFGTPNACNDCHANQSPQWAADWVKHWFGRQRQSHFGEILATGRANTRGSMPSLLALAGDSTQPAIVRATAVELLRGVPTVEFQAALHRFAGDREPLVRAAAAGAMIVLPAPERLALATPLLHDVTRWVRIEAARVLAGVAGDGTAPEDQSALALALQEFRRAQYFMADQPGAHLNLGVMFEALAKTDSAELAYTRAIRLDPFFIPAYANLSTLYNRLGRNPEAERVLRDGIAFNSNDGELHYSLGLLLAEGQRLQEASDELAQAARLLPERSRVHYNYGLTLQHLGQRAQAEIALLHAHRADTTDIDVLNALAIYYMQDQDWRAALPYAQKLVALNGKAQESHQLLEHIKTRLSKTIIP